LETEQKEIQATQGENPQQQAPQAPQSVGTLLRMERERLGLSQAQITEMTRMRTPVVEAIENEAWGSLPPPVFVRGFLKSYAKVLGLSQEVVIDLYAKNLPVESPGQVSHFCSWSFWRRFMACGSRPPLWRSVRDLARPKKEIRRRSYKPFRPTRKGVPCRLSRLFRVRRRFVW
jgi:hypothetical protein